MLSLREIIMICYLILRFKTAAKVLLFSHTAKNYCTKSLVLCTLCSFCAIYFVSN